MAGTFLADLLPELGDGAGQVGGVCQTVVTKAFFRVPGVIAALPRQLLHTKTHTRVNKTRLQQLRILISISRLLAQNSDVYQMLTDGICIRTKKYYLLSSVTLTLHSPQF